MRAWLRLTFQLQRFELLALTAGTVVIVALCLLAAAQLDALAVSHPACFAPDAPVDRFGRPSGPGCAEAFAGRVGWDRLGETLLLVTWIAPVVVGLVLGVAIVARELEHRTAALAWSLGPSRWRWLVGRTLPIVFYAGLVLVAVALAGTVVTGARAPEADLGATFLWYGQWGPLVVARGALVLGLGVVAGALLGRTLPALLIGAALTAAFLTGTAVALDAWRGAEAIEVDFGPTGLGPEIEGGMLVGMRIRTLDGRLLPESAGDGLAEGEYTDVAMIVPGDRYALWVLRESAVVIGLGLGAFGLAGWLVVRRRPT